MRLSARQIACYRTFLTTRPGSRGRSARSPHIARAMSDDSRTRQNVAVIGAGAGGMVAIRELVKAGHSVTAYEQSSEVGGVWVYSDDAETEDLLGLGQVRRKVHGSLYSSLRTNLPRHVMAFTDFPFNKDLTGHDTRLFPGHEEVLRYLQQFGERFSISQHVKFDSQVVSAQPVAAGTNSMPVAQMSGKPSGWKVTIKDLKHNKLEEKGFDAVVVCNGHYSDPDSPEVEGSDSFPGRLLHSHNFRVNDSFKGQRVVVMGASASGQDISREIAEVADTVFFSARNMVFASKVIKWETTGIPLGNKKNIFKRPVIKSLGKDGSVTFSDGGVEQNIDAVVFATGYFFSFPFLEHSGLTKVIDNRVETLYQHIFCTEDPSLSFIGLPWQVIPFPLMELQAKWIAAVLAGQCELPSRQEMEQHTAEDCAQRAADGQPVRYSHRLGERQWEYNAWLAEQVGPEAPKMEAWRSEMYLTGRDNIVRRPDSYRDSFPNAELVETVEATTRAIAVQ